MKNFNLQYITDKEGKHTGVIIPIEEWEKIQQDLNDFFKYMNLRNSLKSALKEMKQLKSNKNKQVSLNDFLNEC